MKNSNIKRILSIFVALSLILSMVSFFPSVIASAEENDVNIAEEDTVSEEKNTEPTNLNDEDKPEEEKTEAEEEETPNDTEDVNNEENTEEDEGKEASIQEPQEDQEDPSQDKEQEDTKKDEEKPEQEKEETKKDTNQEENQKKRIMKIYGSNKSTEKEPRDPKKGSITINKVDGDTGEVLAGAKFELRDSNGDLVDTLETDSNGKVKKENLPLGEYSLYETEAPDGYTVYWQDRDYDVEITEDNLDVVQEVKNYKTGTITITKIDGDTGEPIPGVQFKIYHERTSSEYLTVETDENGKLNLRSLKRGKYRLKEYTTPEGYKRNETMYEFEIGDGNWDLEQTVKNYKKEPIDPKKGSIEINKVDGDTGEVLAGAKFELRDSNGDLVDTLETDSNGKAKKENLPLGEYSLYETEAPDGYTVYWQDRDYDVEITEDNLDVVQKVKNYKTGTITITKIDGDTGEPIPGVRFKIYHERTSSEYLTVETDENGKLNLRSLKRGRYRLKEYHTLGDYKPNTTVYEFEIGDENWDLEQTVENYKKDPEGSIIINKIDGDTGESIDAEFEIYFMYEGEKLKAEGTFTTTNGRLEIEYMPYNTYYIKEIKAPDGYELAKEFEIVIDSEEPVERTVKNYMRGSVSIEKIDGDTKDALAGVEFELRDSKGDLIETLITNENGKLVVGNLPRGEYTLQEVKAPDGYKVDNTKHKIEISAEELDIEKIIENYKDTSNLDPDEPADPTDPVDPTDPTDPVDPTDTEKPIDKYENETGYQDDYLVQTGVTGTFLYYLIGAILILLGIFLFRKKHIIN